MPCCLQVSRVVWTYQYITQNCRLFGNWVRETRAIEKEAGAGSAELYKKVQSLPSCGIPATAPRASFSWTVESSLSSQGLEKTKRGQRSCPDCFSFWPEGWTIQMTNKEARDVLVPIWKVKTFIYPKRLHKNCSTYAGLVLPHHNPGFMLPLIFTALYLNTHLPCPF